MCINRVGKVLQVAEGRARVEFFDSKVLGDVDVSLVGSIQKGGFVEVFGNLALSALSAADARRRKQAWAEIKRAAVVP